MTPLNFVKIVQILSMREKILSSWIMAKLQTLIFKHIGCKKVQNSKSEPTKVSRLCTFMTSLQRVP
jgi:hypothetical protein